MATKYFFSMYRANNGPTLVFPSKSFIADGSNMPHFVVEIWVAEKKVWKLTYVLEHFR